MAARPRTATTAPPASAEGRGTDPAELLARATDGTAIVNEKVAHANAAARKGKRPMFVNIGTASRRRKGDSVPTGAAATIHACHHSRSRRRASRSGSLIDQLLEYARHVLAADHTVLFEVDPATGTVANRACTGVLDPGRSQPGGRTAPPFRLPRSGRRRVPAHLHGSLGARATITHHSTGSAGLSRADWLGSGFDRAGAVRIASEAVLGGSLQPPYSYGHR